jgi:hypothetical protein
MKIALPLLASLACMALAGVPTARAAEPDVAALQHDVQALRAMVLNLQTRVGQLEGRPAAPAAAVAAAPTPTPAPAVPQAVPASALAVVPAAAPVAAAVAAAPAGYVSPEAALRNHWAQVRPEMAQADVTRLLGAPSKKFTLDGRTGWYYVYPGLGSGSVFFTDAGLVSSTHAPFGWGG